MFRTLLVASTTIAAVLATPVAAATTIISFSPASCTGGCSDNTPIDQTFGDTPGVDVTYRTPGGIGNAATFEPFLRYWSTGYSTSSAAWGAPGPGSVGEIRFDVTTPGTLTLNSVDLGGYFNAAISVDYRVYALDYTLLSSGTLVTNPASLTTVSFGNTSTSGLIFQFGPDAYYGGVQNISYTFDPVPEPANWAMLIAGFGLVGAMARRRRAAIV